MALTPFGEEIWLQDGDRVTMWSLVSFETRATIVRLSTGGLWLLSPVRPTQERVAAVQALGPIRHIVAPNKIHGLNTAAWASIAPEAKVWVSPEFAGRHKDIAFDETLADQPPEGWAADLDQLVFQGHGYLDEVEFFHRRSKTLIMTDLIQRHDPEKESWLWRRFKRWGGVLAPNGGVPRDLRALFKDKSAARASLERMLAWEFERLSIAHGICVERDAKAYVEEAFAWLRE